MQTQNSNWVNFGLPGSRRLKVVKKGLNVGHYLVQTPAVLDKGQDVGKGSFAAVLFVQGADGLCKVRVVLVGSVHDLE
jgi:hypothetical protein